MAALGLGIQALITCGQVWRAGSLGRALPEAFQMKPHLPVVRTNLFREINHFREPHT